MILGGFDGRGRPYVEGRVVIPRLQVNESIRFLLDTGADNTSLHPLGARRARIPLDQLENRTNSRGIGGTSSYFREPALLVFDDDSQLRIYEVELRIAEPNDNNQRLPSLLGRNVVNHWYMEYDPTNSRLDCIVRYANYTLDAM